MLSFLSIEHVQVCTIKVKAHLICHLYHIIFILNLISYYTSIGH